MLKSPICPACLHYTIYNKIAFCLQKATIILNSPFSILNSLHAKSHFFTLCTAPPNYLFGFPFDTRQAKKAKRMAAEMPAEAEARGPVRAPSSPFSSTACLVPRAMR